MSMYNNQCERCKNKIETKNGVTKCKAFPNGIPENILNKIRFEKEYHDKVLTGQTGDFIYEQNKDYHKV